MRFDLVLVGFGNVARRFVSLLDEQRAALKRDFGVSARVVGIVTRHHQALAGPESAGLKGPRHDSRAESAGLKGPRHDSGSEVHSRGAALSGPRVPRDLRGAALSGPRVPRDLHGTALSGPRVPRDLRGAALSGPRSTVDFIHRATRLHRRAARERRLIVVESTTLDVTSGRPAIDHVRAALADGAHVVTVNKGPAAFAYADLMRAAERAGRRFLFEGAVMDGVPIFNLARESMPAVRIAGFRGIVNTTTNFMLTAMERGERFDSALAAMQKAGIAEADATLDVDGWDAAAKTAALANVLMNARMTPQEVQRRGITAGIAKRAAAARRGGRRMKLVADAARRGRGVVARVAPRILDRRDFLATIDGRQNALVLTTDLLGEIAIVQRGSGLTQTAYALLSDVLAIARDVRR